MLAYSNKLIAHQRCTFFAAKESKISDETAHFSEEEYISSY